ncbi:hypothetical protein DL98DRAFT_662639 [Cadophora sp. DSE1049]|nr:hypothetical protein DL98DRAFT_662639 [Cadophora sp. DSE1049]
MVLVTMAPSHKRPIPAGETARSRPLVRPEQAEYTQDDNLIRVQPWLCVDYLSHDWKEEEIWASWKYIVSGKDDNGNSARLRNASWRAWMKSKYHLATMPAENINWLKDCDVTWLYGPLQGYSDRSSASYMALSGMGSSELDPLLNKKPNVIYHRAAHITERRTFPWHPTSYLYDAIAQ